MLDREEIVRMTKMKGNGNYFVSCFLNVDPVSNKRGDYIIHIKNMLRDVVEEQDKDIKKKIKMDTEKIDSYIFSHKRDFKKGLALFSSEEAGFWRDIHLSVNLKNEIHVDKSPFVKPLLDVMDRYPRYAIMLLGKETARLFVIHLGEVQEYREIVTENVPGKHKKGGWFSLEQKSFERHTDYHVDLHLKDVIKQLEGIASAGEIVSIVTGGPDEVVSKAKTLFAKNLSERIIGHFSAAMNSQTIEIIEKAQSVIDAFEQQEKTAAVEQLMTMTMKKENAALGIDNVLASLQEGRVMRLMYLRDLRASGHVCDSCGFMSGQQLDSCPYCKKEVRAVDYLVDLAAQKAVEQGAYVEVIESNNKLSRAGGIGAFLRY